MFGNTKWDSLGYELADKQSIVMAEVTLTHDDEDPYDMGMGGGGGDNGVSELLQKYQIGPNDMPTYRFENNLIL